MSSLSDRILDTRLQNIRNPKDMGPKKWPESFVDDPSTNIGWSSSTLLMVGEQLATHADVTRQLGVRRVIQVIK